jgi:hypothetical protein
MTEVSTYVCLLVNDEVDASNKLTQVVNDYFQGMEYKSIYHVHFHGKQIFKPCETTPLKNAGISKYVEIFTDPDIHLLRETIRIEVIDDKDADKKSKDIRDKYFIGKTTKEKRKLQEVVR